MRTGSWLSAATVLALTLAACNGGDKTWGAGVPPVTGGTPGGSTGGDEADAEVPPIGGDGGVDNKVNGVVCEVVDVRFPGNCAPIARAGLLVGLESTTGTPIGTTMTLAGGAFSMPRPTEDTVWLTISDPDSTYHFGAQVLELVIQGSRSVQVPVIQAGYYDDIHVASLVTPIGGSGLVLLHLVHGETPLANAVVGPFRGATAYYDQMDDRAAFSPQTPTTSTGFAVWFNVPKSLKERYNVTVMAGGEPTPHLGSAYPDAVTFLSDVN
jgi:hypothetical protein